MSTITNAKTVNRKSKSHSVEQLSPCHFVVTSGTSGNEYIVRTGQAAEGGATCSCDWGKYRPSNDKSSACSHVQAVEAWIAAQEGRTISAWGNDEDAARQHRPMKPLGDGVIITMRKDAKTVAPKPFDVDKTLKELGF